MNENIKLVVSVILTLFIYFTGVYPSVKMLIEGWTAKYPLCFFMGLFLLAYFITYFPLIPYEGWGLNLHGFEDVMSGMIVTYWLGWIATIFAITHDIILGLCSIFFMILSTTTIIGALMD